MGGGEVIDIERQVEMAGPIHSKGVMILAGFLGQRFAVERPLSLSATLVFEQSYGDVYKRQGAPGVIARGRAGGPRGRRSDAVR